MTAQPQKAPRPQNSRPPAIAEAPRLDLRVGVKSDVGPVRELNEDYANYFLPAGGTRFVSKGAIFLVADGMGGHQAGEVASRLAVECVIHNYYADTGRRPGDSLVRAVKAANQAIYSTAQADASKQGMGATLVAAVILGQRVYVVNVGDSRAYLINGQGITQITQDHSWVEEQIQAGLLTHEQAEQHPQRNLITRALGHDPSVQVDLFKGEIRSGDTLLLCSDGLHGPVSDRQLATIALSHPPSEAAGQLVAQAKIQHANDNISVVVVQTVDPANSQADVLELAEEDVTPTELAGRPSANFVTAISAALQNLIAQIPLSAEKRQWLLVGLATFIFFCCLCGGLSGFLTIRQKLTGNPVAAPQVAPIVQVNLAQDAPKEDLWPVELCVFVVGKVRDWDCQGQVCAFDLDMADQKYHVNGHLDSFSKGGKLANGERVRVFGCQERKGSGFSARLIDRQGPWWVWWQSGWQTVYRNHTWSDLVWVYSIADRNSNSPVDFGDYAGLTRGDRVLLRGKWLDGGVREAMSFDPQDVYRLGEDGYVLISGTFSPPPEPTVTLDPAGG